MAQASSAQKQWDTVNRVVFPIDDRESVMPLYAVRWTRPHVPESVFDSVSQLQRADVASLNPIGFDKTMREATADAGAARDELSDFMVLSRRSALLKPGAHISFCTYFNAFPASYWQRWTSVRSVRLVMQVCGEGEINVFKSTARGLFSTVKTLELHSDDDDNTVDGLQADQSQSDNPYTGHSGHDALRIVDSQAEVMTDLGNGWKQIALEIPLSGLLDGGYFWFDAYCRPIMGSGRSGFPALTIRNVGWQVPMADLPRCEQKGQDGPDAQGADSDFAQATEDDENSDRDGRYSASVVFAYEATHPSCSIAITTFNRTPYCLRQLKAIAGEGELRKRLDTVYCIDQGSDKVCEQDGFDEVSADLGSQLTYIQQANIGGSGGFSRGMLESIDAGRSAYTILLDDDAIMEPESLLRSIQFEDYAKHPVLVGGGMFHLDDRTMLHVQGERFDRGSLRPCPPAGASYNHDFAVSPLRDSPELHARFDCDYSGWWMCLIPNSVIREIGLSLPLFIKYDDVEYGLRAREHGYPTVGLPGVAVWHQGWHDKDISRTWEEYYAQRNRWICALLHFPNAGKRYVFRMMYEDAHLGVKLMYSGMKLHHMALRDVMRGPDNLVDTLSTKLPDVREAREGFDDSRVSQDLEAFPAPVAVFENLRPALSGDEFAKAAAKEVVKAVFSRQDGTHDAAPQVAMKSKDAVWPSFDGVSSALVTTSDGNGAAWLKRDSKLYRRNLRECYRIARSLVRRWDSLADSYRSADLSSPDFWRVIFSS
ncbi:glycosyltransferase [Bifidobacterium sp. ESL0784]|uniref:glycosyltransferase n=1 Tax=Bifidobacterium sp. ESL0784 TaxID=2983231 RepID=UPI0023F91554|nr:glycosyltransferase [Bifidobacterium sp. ESL0784]MDF7640747.1 glycosyltransferase [Bifidobacterium sp. ESL0784]